MNFDEFLSNHAWKLSENLTNKTTKKKTVKS